MSLKSTFTCSKCSKIYKDPIVLPCGHTICNQHVQNQLKIKINCIECDNKEFCLTQTLLSSNHVVRQLIEREHFLLDAEKNLKKKLEEILARLEEHDQIYLRLKESFLIYDVESYDFFRELERQIDYHRENEAFNSMGDKVDDIALTMIDRIKAFEKVYSKKQSEQLKSLLSEEIFAQNIAELKLKLIELFRDPNIVIEDLNGFQRQLEDRENLMKTKIVKINDLRTGLKLNQFKPMESTLTFGILAFDEKKFKQTNILTQFQEAELSLLCEFASDQKWKLLYRGTRDGFKAIQFHAKCDGYSSTLTICQASESKYIFGGYTEAKWQSVDECKMDANAFIFSLTNKDNKPCKMKTTCPEKSIKCSASYGPTFGSGADIYIANKSNERLNSSNLGSTYKHDSYEDRCIEALNFLAGDYSFLLSEIEVYQKE